jgi:hypothetical protein
MTPVNINTRRATHEVKNLIQVDTSQPARSVYCTTNECISWAVVYVTREEYGVTDMNTESKSYQRLQNIWTCGKSA